jgi:hypothetical protein
MIAIVGLKWKDHTPGQENEGAGGSCSTVDSWENHYRDPESVALMGIDQESAEVGVWHQLLMTRTVM